MATQLIGITGRKRSGKDTLAARLVEAHGFRRFAFADRLREALLAIDPIVGGNAADDLRLSEALAAWGSWEELKFSPYDAEVRRLLQRVGVTARDLDPDIWVVPVMGAIAAHDGPAVITDVRFPNELQAVEMADGWTVKVFRPGLPQDDLHISETALDDYWTDVSVPNVGTIAELHAKADALAGAVRRFPSSAWPGPYALQRAMDRRD